MSARPITVPVVAGGVVGSPTDAGARRAQQVMRAGLVASLALFIAGLAIRSAAGGPADALRFTALLGSTDLGDRLLLLGSLVLALTPAVQVASILLGWWRIRDHRFALVAAGVLGLLAVGFLAGGG